MHPRSLRSTREEHDFAELQRLDLGYGYTADGGKTIRCELWGWPPGFQERLRAVGNFGGWVWIELHRDHGP